MASPFDARQPCEPADRLLDRSGLPLATEPGPARIPAESFTRPAADRLSTLLADGGGCRTFGFWRLIVVIPSNSSLVGMTGPTARYAPPNNTRGRRAPPFRPCRLVHFRIVARRRSTEP